LTKTDIVGYSIYIRISKHIYIENETAKRKYLRMKMSNLKKIIISLPESLLRQTDNLVKLQGKNRSGLIREALAFYLTEYKKKQIREQLISGYEKMKEINLNLAEEGMGNTLTDLKEYETKLRKRE